MRTEAISCASSSEAAQTWRTACFTPVNIADMCCYPQTCLPGEGRAHRNLLPVLCAVVAFVAHHAVQLCMPLVHVDLHQSCDALWREDSCAQGQLTLQQLSSTFGCLLVRIHDPDRCIQHVSISNALPLANFVPTPTILCQWPEDSYAQGQLTLQQPSSSSSFTSLKVRVHARVRCLPKQ